MAIEIANQRLNIQGCAGITVSDIVADPDTGGYTRLLQIYVDDVSVANRRPVLEIMLYGLQADLQIATPNLEF